MSFPWPITAAEHAQMKVYQELNRRVSRRNPNENWMAERLRATGFEWKRQATWGKRIFDFWCWTKGIAVEVDGVEHATTRRAWDAVCDEQHYRVSGVLVLRVRNRNEADADEALRVFAEEGSWNARRQKLGLKSLGQGHAGRY